MRLVARAGIASLTFLAVVGCETPEDNNIEQARQCLDTAAQMAVTDPSDASTMATYSCQPLIANDQSKEGGAIGVGIVLVIEQKMGSLTGIENAISAGTSAITTSISFLVFSNTNDISNMTTYAQRSNDPAQMELASIVSLAYFTNLVAGGGLGPNSTPAQVAGYLTALSSDPVNGPPAAAALLSAQSSACAGSGSTSTLCTDLTAAIGPNTSTYGAILSSASTYVQNGG